MRCRLRMHGQTIITSAIITSAIITSAIIISGMAMVATSTGWHGKVGRYRGKMTITIRNVPPCRHLPHHQDGEECVTDSQSGQRDHGSPDA
ncbi:hypothetical protein [Crateriforma spongiae]|uniref:hypothetical protein n=1 Tax=Crateriforma spongiae TaxID=2724528 RepID=UPI001980FBCE|nr:hypothetical protein [Crateriforma spongiae]